MITFVWAACRPLGVADPSDGLYGFEADDAIGPAGWLAGPGRNEPTDGLSVADGVAHGGDRSGQIERTEAEGFTAITLQLPLGVVGEELELRGWLRLEDVTGWAGLWQRQDGASGVRQFDNMESVGLTGTRDWREYRVTLPLDRYARSVSFGALLVGAGRVWLDDVQLRVDGQPLSQAPPASPLGPTPSTRGGVSGVSELQPTPLQVENLALLGKVWGFVKYHHPKVTGGGTNLDDALFEVLPSVLAAQTPEDGAAAIDAWVASLGEPAPCDPCAAPPAGPALPAPLGWWPSGPLGDRLRRIHAARTAAPEQAYVSLAPEVGNPEFGAEDGYPGQGVPDAGYRLLAVFRYWNVIQWWSPYRDLVAGDWDATLAEYVPLALAPATREDYRRMMLTLIARTGDSHANLWSGLGVREPRGDSAVPARLRFVEGQLAVSSADPSTGLSPGDVITAIDGTPVAELVPRWRPLYAGSNEAAILRDLARQATRGPAGPVALEVATADTTTTVTVDRGPIERGPWYHDHPGPPARRLSDSIAYLTLSSVEDGGGEGYVRAAQGAELLVVDLRVYPSAFMVFELGEHLVSEPTPFVTFTQVDLANPGAMVWGEVMSLTPRAPRFEGRVVILVDEVTQSQAEYTAMALRVAPGALVVGSTTAGADGNVADIPLPGGERTLLSGLGVFTPDRRPTQQVGIAPDLVVTPTLAGMRAGRDEVLEAAVNAALGRGLTDAERAALTAP